MDDKLKLVMDILQRQKLTYTVKGLCVFIGEKGRRVDFMAENSERAWMVRWLSNRKNQVKAEDVSKFWNQWAGEDSLWIPTKKPNTYTIQTDRGRIFATLIREKAQLKKV